MHIDLRETAGALKANLERLETEWDNFQADRDRRAVFDYLAAVFELVAWWAHERKGRGPCDASATT